MQCPKCQEANVQNEVPATAKVNVCHNCGWLEVFSVVTQPGMTNYEKMIHANALRRLRVPDPDPTMHTCFMCGKSREQLGKTETRLILGVLGGICARCVELSQGVLQSERVKGFVP